MNEQESLFHQIGTALNCEKSQMFGKPCYKTNKKAFVCFFENAMIFKLESIIKEETLLLPNTILFDPSGKGRPMKEWIQVPFEHEAIWAKLATAAKEYVSK